MAISASTIIVAGIALQITGAIIGYVSYKWYIKKLPDMIEKWTATFDNDSTEGL